MKNKIIKPKEIFILSPFYDVEDVTRTNKNRIVVCKVKFKAKGNFHSYILACHVTEEMHQLSPSSSTAMPVTWTELSISEMEYYDIALAKRNFVYTNKNVDQATFFRELKIFKPGVKLAEKNV